MDKSEKKVILITGAVLALFIFSILYARGKNNDLPECLPFDKVYLEPKVIKLDDKTYQVYAVAQMWQFQPAENYYSRSQEHCGCSLFKNLIVLGVHSFHRNIATIVN